MKKIVALLCISACSWVQAKPAWLTVLGDPADLAVDTIEVDPVPVSPPGQPRIMNVRVSRSEPRISWDGVPYRSYESKVLFECDNHKARYVSIVFYLQPGWIGASHRSSEYSSADARWMEFRDVEPNPRLRIIRAACQTAAVVN